MQLVYGETSCKLYECEYGWLFFSLCWTVINCVDTTLALRWLSFSTPECRISTDGWTNGWMAGCMDVTLCSKDEFLTASIQLWNGLSMESGHTLHFCENMDSVYAIQRASLYLQLKTEPKHVWFALRLWTFSPLLIFILHLSLCFSLHHVTGKI